ncbi:2-methylcitrate dehydratase [Blastococcus colisei]|uniref:2-methylcitrate dehydratase n=1 Tax=Blastococcus colisei TaxID=1564162 RepID=A0A543P1Q6_9ACTN|nr:MmgE/PrpD family protein [Blastococcus colisei]TQN38046.1 2-methylcitrate dehydratase [Blastococcus colisei]
MSDAVAAGLAAFVDERPPSSPEARHEAARRLLDVFALAVSSSPDHAVQVAHSLAEPRGTDDGVTIWGRDGRCDLLGAVLANGVGARYRDMNDAYFNRESLHPSDMVPALAGLAESRQASVGALLDAICVAYDVAVDMADTWRTSSRGADHVNLIRFGTVAGAARLLRLDPECTLQAFAIAASSGIATRQTRRGQLTMWKGWAAAEAGVAGLRAVAMAAAGAHGPTLAFTGDQGFQVLAVDEATWVEQWPFRGAGREHSRILDTHLKVYPVGYLGQAVAEVGLDLHRQLDGVPPVQATIRTYARAKQIMGDPEKWVPRSAETADHSLPYIAALALVHGRVDVDTVPRRWDDPAVTKLLAAVSVDVDEELTAGYPEQMPVRLEVTTEDGAQRAAEVRWPRGHARRPLPDDELARRGVQMLEPTFGARADDLVARILAHDEDQPAARLWQA